MTIRHSIALAAALAAALPALLPIAAQAQSQKDVLQAELQRAITPLIGTDSSADMVKRLMAVRPEGAISRGFNSAKVSQAVFGRSSPTPASDCRSASTAQNEPDEGLCVLDTGKREDPTGAYTMLAYSKNIGLGNIKFMRRTAFNPNATAAPPVVKLSDADAYQKALQFLELVGVPKSEIPQPPPGAKNLLPVRSLVVAAETDPGKGERYAVQKVVSIPRAFAVPGGLYRDPATGIALNHVIAPGGAMLVLDDQGVQFMRVDGWADAQMDPKLDARQAKTTPELVREITDDLYNEGVRRVGTISVLIALRRAYPNPDDPNPPLCPVCGVLRPALKVLISQTPRGRVESSEQSYAAPGLVREYDLVRQTEAEVPSR